MNKMDLDHWFTEGGVLPSALPGYQLRDAQFELSQLVKRSIDNDQTLVAEAGTGTGKTFAYLVPAVLSGKQVIISTGTKNLQDQLFHKDLPLIIKLSELGVKIALLKGRENYLSKHRLKEAEFNRALQSDELQHQLSEVREWAGRTKTGDIAELSSIPENSEIWRHVTARQNEETDENDFCMQARERAREADIIVVNHYLFCADLSVRDKGFGELLPDADVFIFDEAHQLPDAATAFFGQSVSSRQIVELCSDAKVERINEAMDMIDIDRRAELVEKAVKDARLAMGREVESKLAWDDLVKDDAVESALKTVADALEQFKEILKEAAPRGKQLASVAKRAEDMVALWELLTVKPLEQHIHWAEVFSRSFVFHLTPFSVAGSFSRHQKALGGAWIFTSATLAVNGEYEFFNNRLGLEPDHLEAWNSPFDYQNNAQLYVPANLPHTSDPEYTLKILRQAWPVLQATQGRAFLLFTSHKALQLAESVLREHLEMPLFVQGEAPKNTLIERFKKSGNGVLLGTSSFWEGVDVRGDALVCVIIDKLPFASPGDPVVKARSQYLESQGYNPFVLVQIPEAVIALKQGAGRLIRDAADRGVLMICDARLYEKGYGKTFLNSLPKMPSTRQWGVVKSFIEKLDE